MHRDWNNSRKNVVNKLIGVWSVKAAERKSVDRSLVSSHSLMWASPSGREWENAEVWARGKVQGTL